MTLYCYLPIILLIVVVATGQVPELKNIAKGKAVYCSSRFDANKGCYKTINGNVGSNDYFRSVNAPNQWWRVDLKDVYCIQQIVIYNYHDGRFKDVSILVSTESKVTEAPPPESTHWTVIQSGISRDSSDDTRLSYGFTGDEVPQARHVALYTTNSYGLIITEVEVYAAVQNIAREKDTTCSSEYDDISACSKAVDGDVNVSSKENHFTSNESPDQWWRVDLAADVCVHEIVIYNRHYGRFKDVSILVSTESEVTEAPHPESTHWTVIQSGISRVEGDNTRLSYVFTGDEVPQARHVALYTTNSVGLIITEVEVYAVGPHWGSTTTELQADNSSCVTLFWREPEYPSCDIVIYEYRCTGNTGWNSTTPTQLSVQICRYSAYTEVKCDVRFWTSFGASDVITTEPIRTLCSAPSPPQIQYPTKSPFIHISEDGQVLSTYTVTWMVPLNINCESITNYEVRYPTTTSTPILVNGTTTSILTSGNVEITLSVRSKNNAGLYSEYDTLVFTSDKIGPLWVGKTKLNTRVGSSYCVTISWTVPEYPSGGIIKYEYKCTDHTDWTEVEPTVLSTQICGYSPYTEVHCDVRAWNEQTYSNMLSAKSNRTHCAASTPPTSIQFRDTEVVTSDGRLRRKYVVSWQTPSSINCESITEYETRFPTKTSKIITMTSTSRTVYTDGNKEVIFWVRAVNNAGNVSEPEAMSIISESFKPQWGSVTIDIQTYNSSCVNVSWNETKYLNGDNLRYEYKCTDHTEWTLVTSGQLNSLVCGYPAYREVKCEVRPINDADVGDTLTSPSATTLCAAPSTPLSIQFINKGLEDNEGRRRRKYLVSWNTPSTINCESIAEYEARFPTTTSKIITMTSTSRAVYTDGNKEVIFWVRAVNNAGNVSEPEAMSIVSESFRPQLAPQSFDLEVKNSSCIELSWLPPEYPNGPITSYEFKCTDSTDWMKTTEGSAESALICGFSANQLVQCELRAVNSKGKSDIATEEIKIICTDPKLPSDFSPYIKLEGYNTTTNITNGTAIGGTGGSNDQKIRLTLYIPSEDMKINCERLLTLEYRLLDIDTEYIPTGSYFYGLDVLTNYTLSIRAVNNQNFTTRVNWTVQTGELVPSDSPKVRLDFNSSCVTLDIEPPERPNGIITHYLFQCSSDTIPSEVDHNVSRPLYNTTVTDLENEQKPTACRFTSASKVTCTVRGVNGAGESPSVVEYGYTQLQAITNQTQPKVDSPLPGNLIKTSFQEQAYENGEVSKYRIIVDRGTKERRRKRAFSFDSGTCDSNNLYSYTVSVEKGLSCYITAEINGTGAENGVLNFDLGDEKMYGGYENVALVPGVKYVVQVTVVVVVEGEDREFIDYLPTITFKTPRLTEVQTATTTVAPAVACGGGCIAGIVVSLVVCLTVIGFLFARFIFIRRRGENQPKGPTYENISIPDIELLHPDPVPTTSPAEVEVKPESPPPLMPRNASVPVNQLAQYIAEREGHVLHQYALLEKQPKPQMTVAVLPENKGQCKYVGLYPEDSTRVILDREGKPGTDFINASYLQGYSKDEIFIASQGPQPATVDAFWLMVWQQRAKAIVMVTNLVEKGRDKCKRYWPERCGRSQSFGDIVVTLTSTELLADYTIRTLSVQKGEESRKIKQFHFESWPDHGVPKRISPFLAFVRRVRSETSRMSGPMVVHCSAGVGRTGTLISLDILSKQAVQEQEVNPYECVRQMRTRRPCMVQTDDQYVFLHRALEEFLATEEFICEPAQLQTKISSHTGGGSAESSVISQEFQRIEAKLNLTGQNYSLGLEEENVKKNRDPTILPNSGHSMFVGGGYINAVAVDDYRKKEHIIATQLPLPGTVKDFWTMMEEQSVGVIIQLQQQEDEFYPDSDGQRATYDGVIVTRKNQEVQQDVSIINLSFKSNKKERDVVLLLVTGWPEENGKLPDVSIILSSLGAMEKQQQSTGDQKICVTDMNGSSRCGLFICAYIAVEKLKTTQEVDLYSSVLTARYSRYQFISDVESYFYLYKSLQTYIEAFSDYGNFQ